MDVYVTEESKRGFNVPKFEKMPKKLMFFLPAYIGIGGVLVSLMLMSILIPIWLQDIAELEKSFLEEFPAIKNRAKTSWEDLLQIESDDPTVFWARIRRQINDEFSGYDYRPDTQQRPIETEAVFDGKTRQSQYVADPLFNYDNNQAYRGQKCCCDLQAIIASGNFDFLPVSAHCKTGIKGPPGQRGPVGEPGIDGQPGRPGLDFSFFAAGSAFGSDFSNQEDSYSNPTVSAYGNAAPPSSSPQFCEPCPAGRPGPEGPKGRPGNPGAKGVTGQSGKPGLPGRAGPRGPTGDRGPTGRHGYGGVPGPNGADGIRGGKGAPGAPGQRGDTGLSGIRGPNGPDGTPGEVGMMGVRGIRGIKGQRGLDGIDGPPGRPGAPGDDGFYCSCPRRTLAIAGNNDDYGQSFGSNRLPPSAAIHSFAQPARPVTASPPALQPPQMAIQRPFFQNNQHQGQNTRDFTRKIYINEPSPIPVAPRREFSTTGNVQPATFRTINTPNSPINEFENENAFVGQNVFTTNRPPPSRSWQPTDEEQTYGLEAAFLEPRRQLHRHHQIA